MRILAYIVIGLLAAWPVSGMADESAPLLYTRTNIVILRKNPPVISPLPWQDKSAPAQAAPPGVTFDAEVRDATTIYKQEGWYNLSAPSENAGTLMMFREPSMDSIAPAAQYVPLDILMIDREGKIVQIMPNIVLSDLQQNIAPDVPVLAFLFLKGGTCAKLAIAPGDTVDYKLFKQSPTVLGAPASAEKLNMPVITDVPVKPPTPLLKQ